VVAVAAPAPKAAAVVAKPVPVAAEVIRDRIAFSRAAAELKAKGLRRDGAPEQLLALEKAYAGGKKLNGWDLPVSVARIHLDMLKANIRKSPRLASDATNLRLLVDFALAPNSSRLGKDVQQRAVYWLQAIGKRYRHFPGVREIVRKEMVAKIKSLRSRKKQPSPKVRSAMQDNVSDILGSFQLPASGVPRLSNEVDSAVAQAIP
jgi:hypothetical protein